MNTAKTDLLVHLAKGNKTTPEEQRAAGLQSQFAAKLNLNKYPDCDKHVKQMCLSESDSSDSETSDEDFLGLEHCEDPEIEYVPVSHGLQA